MNSISKILTLIFTPTEEWTNSHNVLNLELSSYVKEALLAYISTV